ncbi:MAG: sugar-binding domain-containing protein, partial [Candidatus Hydrogenedentales bacterium]
MKYFLMLSLALLFVPFAAQAWDDPGLHPRPDWARPYINLNGAWRFDFDPNDSGVQEAWFDKHDYAKSINVPFPWQSKLSGIQATDYNGVAWYERDVTIPADAGPRIFVVFGAIDWKATVYANGKELVTHEGGYVPFEVELTAIAKPGETVRLTVRAEDRTDADLPTGKQIHWYTQTGGIWQTVYLESRGNAYLKQAHAYPDIDNAKAGFEVTVEAPAT